MVHAFADPKPALLRRLLAEAVGTALLVTVVVGSGIAAQRLSPSDVGLHLLEKDSIATAMGLAVPLLLFGAVSGGHFPTLPFRRLTGFWGVVRAAACARFEVAAYSSAQVLGGVAGAVLANIMHALPAAQLSERDRATGPVLLAEVVATAGLVALIFALA